MGQPCRVAPLPPPQGLPLKCTIHPDKPVRRREPRQSPGGRASPWGGFQHIPLRAVCAWQKQAAIPSAVSDHCLLSITPPSFHTPASQQPASPWHLTKKETETQQSSGTCRRVAQLSEDTHVCLTPSLWLRAGFRARLCSRHPAPSGSSISVLLHLAWLIGARTFILYW